MKIKKFIPFLIAGATILLMAHDYWFDARPFILSPGEETELHLLVGDDGKVTLERSLEKKMTPTFRLYHKNDMTDLLTAGEEGDNPVVTLTLSDPGLYLLVMERDFAYITLTNEEFLGYLKHEEITEDKHLTEHMGARDQQRERYARSVKSLLYVRGTENMSDLYRKVFGHPYELVLLDNPYLLRGGGKITAQVLRNGLPAPGKKVMAHHLPEKEFREIIKVSDKKGKVTFDLPEGGEWLIRSLDLNPCNNCDTINWESHWASFSFYVPE